MSCPAHYLEGLCGPEMNPMPKAKSIPQTSRTDMEVGPKDGEEIVRQKAYEIYLDRVAKRRPGNPEDDWQKAKRMLGKSNGKS